MFSYLGFPFFEAIKSASNYSSYHVLANKTFVFSGGEILATYRKRRLDIRDFPNYETEKEMRYFRGGKHGNEQNRYKGFFQIFSLEICKDHLANGRERDYREISETIELPPIHIIQSNTLNEIKKYANMKNGLFIKVDSFEDRSFLAKVKENTWEKIDVDFKIVYDYFLFYGWNNIKL